MTKKSVLETSPESYVEHNGQTSLVFPDGGDLTALVTGNDLYEVWVVAATIEDLAVKYGYVLDNVMDKLPDLAPAQVE